MSLKVPPAKQSSPKFSRPEMMSAPSFRTPEFTCQTTVPIWYPPAKAPAVGGSTRGPPTLVVAPWNEPTKGAVVRLSAPTVAKKVGPRLVERDAAPLKDGDDIQLVAGRARAEEREQEGQRRRRAYSRQSVPWWVCLDSIPP